MDKPRITVESHADDPGKYDSVTVGELKIASRARPGQLGMHLEGGEDAFICLYAASARTVGMLMAALEYAGLIDHRTFTDLVKMAEHNERGHKA